MDSDEITERPDLLEWQLLDTKGGGDFWRNDGVIAYSLVRSEKREEAPLASMLVLVLVLSVTAPFASSGYHIKPN